MKKGLSTLHIVLIVLGSIFLFFFLIIGGCTALFVSSWDTVQEEKETKELSAIEKWELTKKDVNIIKSLKTDNYGMTIILKSVGLMKFDDREMIRMDFIVENNGKEVITFFPQPVLLTKNQGQYSPKTIYKFENRLKLLEEIHPEVIREGSIFFDTNEDFEFKKVILETGLSPSIINSFFGTGKDKVDDADLYDGGYVFQYDLSDLDVYSKPNYVCEINEDKCLQNVLESVKKGNNAVIKFEQGNITYTSENGEAKQENFIDKYQNENGDFICYDGTVVEGNTDNIYDCTCLSEDILPLMKVSCD
ncbi:hypothetical protein HOA91_02700 [Candidatus Woesearchaeota archaeon]|nr:hypothetical protein [Candidatus Woesearchaeota archaeon]